MNATPIESRAQAVKQGAAWRPLLWLLLIPAINLLYVLQNRAAGNARSLVTEVDGSIPFVPAFALPYSLWYPFLFVVFVLVLRKDRREYFRLLLAFCLGLLLSNLVFLVFQTTVPRPEIGTEGFFHGIVSFIYANDQPYNCFPSVHVLTSALMIYGARRLRTAAKIPIAVVAVSIIVSTVFIKQHVIADVMAGLLAAKLVFWLAGKLIRRFERRRELSDKYKQSIRQLSFRSEDEALDEAARSRCRREPG